MKQLLASYHFVSAAHNGRLAGKLEEAYDGDMEEIHCGERFKRWQPIHDSHVISSVISSFAGLEAGINEFWDQNQLSTQAETANCETENRPSTLEKYNIALRTVGCEEFNTGEEPYQSVDLLRSARNYFVHYEPEFIHEDSHRLADGFRTKGIELNPFREIPTNGAMRPFEYLSYDCSRWAIESSFAFLESFFSRQGARNRFELIEKPVMAEFEMGWEETEPRF